MSNYKKGKFFTKKVDEKFIRKLSFLFENVKKVEPVFFLNHLSMLLGCEVHEMLPGQIIKENISISIDFFDEFVNEYTKKKASDKKYDCLVIDFIYFHNDKGEVSAFYVVKEKGVYKGAKIKLFTEFDHWKRMNLNVFPSSFIFSKNISL